MIMKKILGFSLIICFSVLTTVFAQSKDETAVASAVEALKKAMIDADKTALENNAADALSYGGRQSRVCARYREWGI